MLFVLSVLLAVLITVPGMYLIMRAKLASSLLEVLSTGFFLGFGIVVLFYLGCSNILPYRMTDYLVLAASIVSVVLLVREQRKQALPFKPALLDLWQLLLIAFASVFMLVLTFGDLATLIDDDVFIHLANIKRIAMGDVPPHLPYFPDVVLRGHIARDLFIGTVARFLHLTPELAIISVTLAVVPFYIGMFYVFACRMAREDRMLTAFCFFGTLFLVSFAIGTAQVRAGSITYIWNNNIFAFSHSIFMGWLVERAFRQFSAAGSLLQSIRTHKLVLLICVLSYSALYFIYISNFLMFSIFFAAIPFAVPLFAQSDCRRQFLHALAILAIIAAGTVASQLLVSPFMMERILIALNIYRPAESVMVFTQQAHLTFPKEHLFSITDPGGIDIPFLTASSLSSQGLSFYLGLLGLAVGIATRRLEIAFASLFGWLALLWLLFVDMGDYRAETLRLMLVAHQAYGAVAGLLIGLGVKTIDDRLKAAKPSFDNRYVKVGAILAAMILCWWAGEGNFKKFVDNRHWEIVSSYKNMKTILSKNPEHWHQLLNTRRIDAEAFRVLESYVRKTNEKILIKLEQDSEFKGYGHPVNKLAFMINAASTTGAGVVGVCYQHKPPQMSKDLYPCDYRATLFWLHPTPELLEQLDPNYIVLNPALVSPANMRKVLSMSCIQKVCTLEDGDGRKRLVLRYRKPDLKERKTTAVNKVLISTKKIVTEPNRLSEISISSDSQYDLTKAKLGLLVLDKSGHLVNATDVPIVPVCDLDGKNFTASFAMLQPGLWDVHLVEPGSLKRLNDSPLEVEVKETDGLAAASNAH